MNAKPRYLANYAQDLRLRMQAIRNELPGDVQQVRTEVNNLTDWKYYVRSYPEYVLPAVALATFALVPKSHASGSHRSHHRNDSLSDHEQEEQHEQEVQQSSMLAGLTSAAATLATRSLLTAASRYGTQFLMDRFGPTSQATFASESTANSTENAADDLL